MTGFFLFAGIGGRGKLFFPGKEVFPLPRTPILFQKKRGMFALVGRFEECDIVDVVNE